MLYLCYLCRFKPLRDHLRGFLIAAWAGDKIAEFSFPEISFHFPLRPWFFFVSPAYAGKRRTIPRRRSAAPDHPRVCGEKLYPICSSIDLWGSPPRMRGKAKEEPYRPCHPGITPRMCGEKSAVPLATPVRVGSPPHVRGKAPFGGFAKVPGGITPAYAGKRSAKPLHSYNSWDHPRVCGEKGDGSSAAAAEPGSPPRMRGKVLLSPFFQPMPGITPAYAGKRVFASTRLCNSRDHPRMCGEKKNCLERGGEKAGSPPHVRGKANQRL